jgi:rhodanese-related sulfurtransferase
MQHLSAPELAQAMLTQTPLGNVQLLDVREAWELEIVSLPGAKHIPMSEVTTRFNELDPDQTVVCICHHGVRSLQVGMFLERQGFDKVVNLTGGVDAWAKTVDTSCSSY